MYHILRTDSTQVERTDQWMRVLHNRYKFRTRRHAFPACRAFIPVEVEGSDSSAHLRTVLIEWGVLRSANDGAVGTPPGAMGEAVMMRRMLCWPRRSTEPPRLAGRSILMGNHRGKKARPTWPTTRLVCQQHREGPRGGLFSLELLFD